MWRTPILVPILLLILASPARTEEVAAPPGIDPAKVAKLLLSADEAERNRGVALLQERVRRGGDVQTWLVAMARTQTEWADAEERLVERWIFDVVHGSLERAKKARRLLAAVGRDATRRLLESLRNGKTPAAPSAAAAAPQHEAVPAVPRLVPDQQADVPPPQRPVLPTTPQAPRTPVATPSVPAGWIRARVIEVPNDELRSYFQDQDPLEHNRTALVETQASGVFERIAALPEARVHAVAPSRLPIATARDVVLVDGTAVRYRSRVRKTKGAWAVETATLRRGLQVSVRLEDEVFEVKARFVSLRLLPVVK